MRLAPNVDVRQNFALERVEFNIGSSPMSTPILVNNFNRLSCLKRLVDALRMRGYENIYVIDNSSTYEPLLDYYDSERLRVFYLSENVGYLALWRTGVGAHFVGNYYVYTDSDIEPTPECPGDFIEHFAHALNRHIGIDKVGFGLKIDDLPRHYALRDSVIEHEKQFLTSTLEPGLYRAPIDTTFALYRPGAAGGSWLQCLRTGEPYVARHLPWYEDSACPTEEEKYYRQTTQTSTHWTCKHGSDAKTLSVCLWDDSVRVVSGRNDVLWNMVSRGEWEPESYDILDRFLDASHSYLELGSQAGQTALYAARLAQRVYAVETDLEYRGELSQNLSLNDVDNVEVVGVPDGADTCSKYAAAFEEVAARRAVDLSLIKIDLGGDEYQVLPTMLRFIRVHRPTLYLSLHPRQRFGIMRAGLLDRAKVAVLSFLTTLSVLHRLRFYRNFYDLYGDKLTLRRLMSISRGELSVVVTDEEWSPNS